MSVSSKPLFPYQRFAFLLAGGVSLFIGLNAGLLRLGAHSLSINAELGSLHGPLMIFGFLGTVIGLERAVALQSDQRRVWAYIAPLLAALGGACSILLTTGHAPAFVVSMSQQWGPRIIPGTLWTFGMLALAGIYLTVLVKRVATSAVYVELISAVVGACGAALWTRGFAIPLIVHWWLVYVVLTIYAERLELAHIVMSNSGTDRRILIESAALALTLPLTLLAPSWGLPIMGVTLLIMTADMAWHDVARRLVRTSGVPRFSAAAMLAGYSYAGVASVVWLMAQDPTAGYVYDLVVHAVTIGCVMSMIIAHAPIIIPSLIHRDVPYHPIMWLILLLLHIALAFRVFGASHEIETVWRFGGTMGSVVVVVFVASTVALIIRQNRLKRDRS